MILCYTLGLQGIRFQHQCWITNYQLFDTSNYHVKLDDMFSWSNIDSYIILYKLYNGILILECVNVGIWLHWVEFHLF